MRRVVLILGPPGAGKTTLAHTLGLDVYDLDDEQWMGSDSLFRTALRTVGADPNAQAVVIRTGTTSRSRHAVASLCHPTETRVLATPKQTCIDRIKERNQGDVAWQLEGVEQWWASHDAQHVDTGLTPQHWTM